MKSIFFAFLFITSSCLRSQCTYSCSNYSVSAVNYSFVEVAGTPVYLNDDDISTTIPINFNFDFYCATQNQVRIASNGFITFEFVMLNLALTPLAQMVPHPAKPNAVIAWNWNDLDPSSATGAGTISYTTIGVSPNQQFIVTYSAVPIWTDTPGPSNLLNTGQIILHETTNIIEINIKEATDNGWVLHTEGIEDFGAASGLGVPSRNQSLWTVTHSSHIFTPFVVTSSVVAGGTPSLCQGTQAQFTVNASPAPLYYTWSLPPAWTGNSNSSGITTTVAAAGVVTVVANYTCGASEQTTLFVNVVPSPVIGFSSVSPTIVCAGQPINVVGKGAATYTLNPGNYQGAPSFTAIAPASGVRTLSGTSDLGCNSANTPTVFINVKPSPTVIVNSGEICHGESYTITPTGAFSYEFLNGFPVMEPAAPGVYPVYIVGMGTNFCKSQPAVSSFTVHDLPKVTVVATRSFICRGETSTVTVTGAKNYLWEPNITSNSVIVVSPEFMTNYVVTGMDENGCVNKSSASVLVSSCVGLENTGESITGISIYPNPTNGTVKIVTWPDRFLFKLTDVLGKEIFSGEVYGPEALIDLSGIPSGTYSFIVIHPTASQRGKLIRN